LGIGAQRLEKNKKSLSKYLRYVVICGYYVSMENNPTHTTPLGKPTRTNLGDYRYRGFYVERFDGEWLVRQLSEQGWVVKHYFKNKNNAFVYIDQLVEIGAN